MKGLALYASLGGDTADDLIARGAPQVKRIAYHLLARLPASVQVDDLIQAGMLGLLEAARRYDPAQGASFATFAEPRIRGAMLDEIRKGDWTPRSVHRKAREVTAAIHAVETADWPRSPGSRHRRSNGRAAGRISRYAGRFARPETAVARCGRSRR